jgi:hypothetical protein
MHGSQNRNPDVFRSFLVVRDVDRDAIASQRCRKCCTISNSQSISSTLFVISPLLIGNECANAFKFALF